MHVGCNTLSFVNTATSDADAIQLLASAGFKYIDLNLNRYSVRDPVDPFWSLSVAEQQKYASSVKEAAKNAGVIISQVHAPYPTYFPSAKKRKDVFSYIESSIYIAALIGSPYVVVHPLVPPESKTQEEVKDAIEAGIDYYRGFADILRQTGVQLALENMFNWDKEQSIPLQTVASTAECMCYMLDTLNHMTGGNLYVACLDTGHGMLTGGGDLPHMVKLLSHRLRLLHIHDNDGKRDRHQPPYTGIIDWDAFARALAEIDYKGVLSLEIKADTPDLKTAQKLFVSAERFRLTLERERKL